MSLVTRRELIAQLLVAPVVVPRLVGRARQRADLTALTIAEATERVARRDVSPIELTEAYLRRIAEINPDLNAFVTVTAERARSDAHRASARSVSRRASRPSLTGIPIAHKDLFETAGIRTTAGSRLFEAHVPARDAAVVAALSAEGAVLLGKTNTHELGGGVTTINPFYGTTRNPIDRTRIPGGSSGGSAAAVVARLAAAATGSDTGGSVRIPAALCGCVGFKPTFGRLSTRGLLGACPTFDHVGLLTRTATDAALLFETLTARARSRPRPAQPLRVGVARAFFFDRLQPDVSVAMTRAVDRFRSLGASVIDRDLPIDAGTMSRVFDPIVAAEVWARYADDWRTRPQAFSSGFAEFFTQPAPAAVAVSAARRALKGFQDEVARVFQEVDIVFTPTVPVTAPPIAGPIDGGLILRNTWPFNAARTPTISLPCGTDSAGLPIGLQLAARVGNDWELLEAARAFESVVGRTS